MGTFDPESYNERFFRKAYKPHGKAPIPRVYDTKLAEHVSISPESVQDSGAAEAPPETVRIGALELTYSLTANEATLVKVVSVEEQLIIPEFLGGMPVRFIASGAFAECLAAREIILPAQLESMSSRAFELCNSLEHIQFPPHFDGFNPLWLKRIKNIEDFWLPPSLTYLKVGLFANAKPRCLHIGPKLQSFEKGAFGGSTLKSLEIHPENPYLRTDGYGIYDISGEIFLALAVPCTHYRIADSCRIISKNSFAYNRSIKEVEIPGSVEHIGAMAFYASSLEHVEIHAGVKSIGELAFAGCTELTQFDLPEGLKTIEIQAFARCAIESLLIPSSVETIGFRAFLNCPALKTADRTGSWDLSGFSVSADNQHISCDTQGCLYQMHQGAWVLTEVLSNNIERLVIAPGVDAIGPSCACSKQKLISIEMPDSVRYIGDYAFFDCQQLADLGLSSHVETIGTSAFAGSAITAIELPKTLQSLGSAALNTYHRTRSISWNTLKSIRVDPDNPRYKIIGGVLCRVEDQGTCTVIAYAGNTPTVVLPPNATSIEEHAFAGATGIRSIHIGCNVYHIGSHAFEISSELENIDIDLSYPKKDCEAIYHLLCALQTQTQEQERGVQMLGRGLMDPSKNTFTEDDRHILDAYLNSPENPETLARTVRHITQNATGFSAVICLPTYNAEQYSYANMDKQTRGKVLKLASFMSINHLELTGFDVEQITADDLREPLWTHSFNMRPLTCSPDNVQSLFYSGNLDLSWMIKRYDYSIVTIKDKYKCARAILMRFEENTLLSAAQIESFKRFLELNLDDICSAFAQRNFTAGFDQLVGHALIGEHNIDDLINDLSRQEHVIAVNHLLQIRNQCFKRTAIDFEL